MTRGASPGLSRREGASLIAELREKAPERLRERNAEDREAQGTATGIKDRAKDVREKRPSQRPGGKGHWERLDRMAWSLRSSNS